MSVRRLLTAAPAALLGVPARAAPPAAQVSIAVLVTAVGGVRDEAGTARCRTDVDGQSVGRVRPAHPVSGAAARQLRHPVRRRPAAQAMEGSSSADHQPAAGLHTDVSADGRFL
ncbi:hypothetical protein [Streptomyces chiangmaiensis]|uniref:Uncharacterized protein n=1 Tax=Streptomyces chiangmaiensis TaxID=766497 RepID=A0ABU7FTM2_9ACTN|nr:hypothetical protein [Streptomyces chiangmaiensis]MED7827323.1 hypothetical protein [Streptomyces chiangmaiensis]